jgi:hypothetical protein
MDELESLRRQVHELQQQVDQVQVGERHTRDPTLAPPSPPPAAYRYARGSGGCLRRRMRTLIARSSRRMNSMRRDGPTACTSSLNRWPPFRTNSKTNRKRWALFWICWTGPLPWRCVPTAVHAMRTHIFSLAQVLREWVLHLRSGHGRAAARAGNPAAASAGRAGRRVKS